MKTHQENSRSRTAGVGCGILLGVSALLILEGLQRSQQRENWQRTPFSI